MVGRFMLVSSDDTLGRDASSPCDMSFHGRARIVVGVCRLIANHLTSPSSEACQKSGPFAPPALPGLHAPTTLSDSRCGRHPKATLRPLPSPTTGLPLQPRTTLPTCCAHYPGGSSECACRLLPRSCCIPPKGAHNVGSLAFEVAVSYPFHPFVGKSVLVVGDKEHAGTRHLIIRGPDGAKILLPEWMAAPDAGAIRIVSHPRLCVNRLVELRALVDRLMASSLHKNFAGGEQRNETIADVTTGSLQDIAFRAAIPTTKDGSGNAQDASGRGDDDAHRCIKYKRRQGQSGARR